MTAPSSISITPRGLSAPRAAQYLGVSETKLRELVMRGDVPRPRRIDSRVLWDRMDLDNYFENLPREGDNDQDWAEDVAI